MQATSVRYLGVAHTKVSEQGETYSTRIPREQLLRHRTALITNCDTTHGELPRNLCAALASYGANVLVHGENNEHVVSQIYKSLPIVHDKQNHAYIISQVNGNLNITLGKEVKQFTESLEIVVHNNGNMGVPTVDDAANYDIQKFDGVVRQNLTTPYALFQSLQPLILAGNNPSVIFASSSPEHQENSEGKEPHDSAYYVSKFGFNTTRMLTKMLSEGLSSRGVRVNAVDPGRFLSHGNEAIALGGKSDSAKTNAFVWLARPDTEMNGAQVDANEWIRRDPVMFKSFY